MAFWWILSDKMTKSGGRFALASPTPNSVWLVPWFTPLVQWRVALVCVLRAVDVVNRVRNGESIPFRPQLPESSELGKAMLDMIRNCWNENPEHRPTFQQIRTTLRKMTNGESVISSQLLHLLSVQVTTCKTVYRNYWAYAFNCLLIMMWLEHRPSRAPGLH